MKINLERIITMVAYAILPNLMTGFIIWVTFPYITNELIVLFSLIFSPIFMMASMIAGFDLGKKYNENN